MIINLYFTSLYQGKEIIIKNSQERKIIYRYKQKAWGTTFILLQDWLPYGAPTSRKKRRRPTNPESTSSPGTPTTVAALPLVTRMAWLPFGSSARGMVSASFTLTLRLDPLLPLIVFFFVVLLALPLFPGLPLGVAVFSTPSGPTIRAILLLPLPLTKASSSSTSPIRPKGPLLAFSFPLPLMSFWLPLPLPMLF